VGFKIGWALVVKAGVQSGPVVEDFDVIKDGATRLGVSGEAVVVSQFVFEAAEKAFDKSVVVAVAFATHGGG
jgi:imidazole glycerol phosphate synthase subunit HisF